MNNGKFFAGLALGALVGSALSCFAHSNRGRKLRRDVYDAIWGCPQESVLPSCFPQPLMINREVKSSVESNFRFIMSLPFFFVRI